MTISKSRARKIGQRMQQELAQILLREAKDPRLSALNVTGVEVDRELAYATIHVHSAVDEDEQKLVLHGLESASGFLRSRLAGRIELRKFPQLRFRWDDTPTRGARIEDLLQQIRTDRSGDRVGE